MRSWAAKKVLSPRALPEGDFWGACCNCHVSSRSRKGELGSMRKPVEKVTLMNVKHCSFRAAPWSSLVDLTRLCMWAEALSDSCPLQRWLQLQLPLHRLLRDREYTGQMPSLCSIGRWSLILSSWIWAGLGLAEVMLLPNCWTVHWEQNKMVIALCH